MALALMAQRWARTRNVTVIPMIVDHALRPGSSDEASWTCDQLRHHGLCPIVMRWEHHKITSGLMAKARQKRYELLALACHRLNIAHILIAHHADDILETCWMRTMHKSREHGMAGISSIVKRYGVVLIRPLMNKTKADLQDFLRTIGQTWLEDPSNTNPRFFRTHARSYINTLSETHKQDLIQNIKNCATKRTQYEHDLFKQYPVYDQKTYLLIEWSKKFDACTTNQGIILLRSWLSFFTFSTHYTHRLAYLWHQISRSMASSASKITGIIAHGGGCVFLKQKNNLYIIREHGRLPHVSLDSINHVWDSRWFCYGIVPKIPERKLKGPIKEQLITSAIPCNSTCSSILYRPCSYPFPFFETHVPWGLDQIAF